MNTCRWRSKKFSDLIQLCNYSQDEEIILQECDSDSEVDDGRHKRRNGEIDEDEEKEDYSLRVHTPCCAAYQRQALNEKS